MEEEGNVEEFTRLLVQHQRRVYDLINSLVPCGSDADDVMQDASAVMWRKFDTFEKGTNFGAWALKIARFQVMTYYNRKRRAKARLSDQALDMIVDRMAADRVDRRERVEALQHCLGRLSDGNRELIALRYEHERTVEDVAAMTKRNLEAVYKALQRTQLQLLRCVRTNLSAGALS